MGCKLFTRPYCGTQLNWWILQDECDPAKAPDVVVQEDPSFSPLATAQADPAFLQLLKGWDSSSSLEALISILLGLYAEHNKARIAAAVTDERILFELSMLDEIGCREVLLTGEAMRDFKCNPCLLGRHKLTEERCLLLLLAPPQPRR
jgi:hypothetical protein